MNAKKLVASAILLGGLSACGTLGDVIELGNISTELLEAGVTVPDDMPESGTANYTGKAAGFTYLYNGAEASHLYISDASIDVAFTPAGGTLDGEVTNMTGFGRYSDDLVAVSGEVRIF